MKKTVIALACALISSGALAASITHGTSTMVTSGGGTYAAHSNRVSQIEVNPFTYTATDGDEITIDAFIKNTSTVFNENGSIANAGVQTSSWVSNGAISWGTTGGFDVKQKTIGSSHLSSTTNETQHYIVTKPTSGADTFESVDANVTSYDEWKTGTTTFVTATNGIFLE